MRTPAAPRPTMPVNLLVEGRPCLVVGGGAVAWRKIEHLMSAGASVTVVAPAILPAIADLAAAGRLRLETRAFEPADVRGQAVVFAATDSAEVNRCVLEAGRQAGCLVCAVDANWPHGDFITPAVVRQGDLTVAISAGGGSPARLRALRQRLADWLASLTTGHDDGATGGEGDSTAGR